MDKIEKRKLATILIIIFSITTITWFHMGDTSESDQEIFVLYENYSNGKSYVSRFLENKETRFSMVISNIDNMYGNEDSLILTSKRNKTYLELLKDETINTVRTYGIGVFYYRSFDGMEVFLFRDDDDTYQLQLGNFRKEVELYFVSDMSFNGTKIVLQGLDNDFNTVVITLDLTGTILNKVVLDSKYISKGSVSSDSKIYLITNEKVYKLMDGKEVAQSTTICFNENMNFFIHESNEIVFTIECGRYVIYRNKDTLDVDRVFDLQSKTIESPMNILDFYVSNEVLYVLYEQEQKFFILANNLVNGETVFKRNIAVFENGTFPKKIYVR